MVTTDALTEAAESLKPALNALPPADRLALAHFLYDSVDESETIADEDYEVAWAAELNRRIKETEMGMGGEVSGDEMRRIARESLK